MSKTEDVIKEVNSHFSRKVLTVGSDPKLRTAKITSGSYAVDYILRGGFPRGRSVEIFGDWQTGKTYLALRTIAEAQQRGEACVYMDVERCLDVAWAEELGVDLNTLTISSDLGCGEEVIDIVEGCLRLGTFSVIVIDSVSALIPKQEMEKSATELSIGQMGKLMSLAMRKLTAANPNAVLMFLNQTREKIGMVFGDPTTTPGGRALGYYASQRLRLKLGKKIKDESKVIGQEVRALVEKDKTGSPFSQITFVFDFTKSRMDKGEELFAICLNEGLITKAGRFQFDGDSYTRKKLVRHLTLPLVEREVVRELGLVLHE